MTKRTREKVFAKYAGHCAYCGRALTMGRLPLHVGGVDYYPMQIDHILARDKGGGDELENLNPACRVCNFYKTTFDLETFRRRLLEFQARLEAAPAFVVKLAAAYGIVSVFPRGRWDGRFYFEREGGEE